MTFLRLFVFCLAFAIAFAPMGGCQLDMPTPVHPIPVREADLISIYHDDPAKAKLAYEGQQVRVLVNAFTVVGNSMEVPIVGGKPAALILRFPGPVPQIKSPCWVVGKCAGRVEDGKDRLLAGYTFHVIVVDCVLSEAP